MAKQKTETQVLKDGQIILPGTLKHNRETETTSELVLIQPLNEVVIKSGLEKTKAEKYALGYAPLMREVIEQADLLKGLDKTNPDDAAKAKRVSLDLGKICSRLTTKKKEDKDTLLIETRLIDGLFNVAESTARLTQKEADEIVDYLANIERERLAALADTRRAELESYGADTSYLPLEIMGDEQYARCLESAQLAFEARKVAAEKLEADRLAEIERVRLAEIEAARLQAERIEAERLEAIRVKEELAAREQELVKEREQARIEQERRDAELEKERKQRAAEAEKLAKENEAKLAEQKRLAEIESKKQADILAKQKAEAEKLAKELQAKKDAEEKQRKEFEAQAKADEEKRTAALRAPDKEKVRALFDQIKAITIPEFGTTEGKNLGDMVLGALKVLQADIINESKKLL